MPVPHPPWVEDRSLELRREVLLLEVGVHSVAVRAWFRFLPRSRDAAKRSHAMLFAVGDAGGPAQQTRAELVFADGRRVALETRASQGGSLPAAGTRQRFEFVVPKRAFAAASWLLVSYRQRAADHFTYVLSSGAYWAGPIHELRVRLSDPHRRVREAMVEGRPGAPLGGGELEWSFSDIEPRQPIRMTLR